MTLNFYQDITQFYGFYDLMAEIIPNNCKWLEVGAWLGNSIIYAEKKAKSLNKSISFTVVDKWEKYEELEHFWQINGWDDEGAYHTFLENISNFDNIKHVRETSWVAANLFEDRSFDLIFIDGAHDYETVSKDLRAYWPKVKSGGWFAGDDYIKKFYGLRQAVDEWAEEELKQKIKHIGPCWFVKKI